MTLVHVQSTGLMNADRNQSEQQPSVCTTASLSSGMNLPQLILPQERCRDAQRCRAGCCGVSGHQDQGKPSPISDHLLGGAYFFPLLQCIQKAFLFIVQTDRIVTSYSEPQQVWTLSSTVLMSFTYRTSSSKLCLLLVHLLHWLT